MKPNRHVDAIVDGIDEALACYAETADPRVLHDLRTHGERLDDLLRAEDDFNYLVGQRIQDGLLTPIEAEQAILDFHVFMVEN